MALVVWTKGVEQLELMAISAARPFLFLAGLLRLVHLFVQKLAVDSRAKPGKAPFSVPVAELLVHRVQQQCLDRRQQFRLYWRLLLLLPTCIPRDPFVPVPDWLPAF